MSRMGASMGSTLAVTATDAAAQRATSEGEPDMNDFERGGDGGGRQVSAGLVGGGVVAAALVAFVVQNTDDVPVNWLFFESDAPLWLVILIAAVAGAVLSEVGGWFLRRARRD